MGKGKRQIQGKGGGLQGGRYWPIPGQSIWQPVYLRLEWPPLAVRNHYREHERRYQNTALWHLMLVLASPRALWGGPESSEGLTDAGPDAPGRYVHQGSVRPTVEAFEPDPGVPRREVAAFGGALLELAPENTTRDRMGSRVVLNVVRVIWS